MASVGGFFGKFFGNTIGEAAAFGIGGALRRPLEPPLQELTNETWRAAVAAGVNVPLDAADAAEIVAEDVELQAWGADQAAQTGIGGPQFDAVVRAALNAPGVPDLLTLWRRGEINETGFAHGLRKTRLETLWDGPLKALKAAKLTPQQIALGIVRSVVRDPGLLAVTLDTSDSNVAKYPEYPGDALTEAAAAGIDEDQLRVMVGTVGLPMAAISAAQAFFKGILTRGAYNQAILEGDTRPEWADTILENARQILTAHDGIEDHLRGWSDENAMYAQTARHGMSQADTDVLFRITGRPLSWHQVWIGLQRGGTYDGPIDDIDPAFLKALRESNIRPEWYNLAWAQRYNYPTAFVLRQLTSSGDITPADAEQVLLFEGWEPTFAHKAALGWAPAGQGGQSPIVKSSVTAAVTAIRKAYVIFQTTEADARADLARLTVPQADIDALIKVWDVQSDATLPALTVTQIQKGNLTRDQQEAALTRQGYDGDEILELLGPPPPKTF